MKSSFIRRKLKQNKSIFFFILNLKNKYYHLFYKDEKFFRINYKKTHGEYPDLENPKTYSEKLLWSMINYRNDLYITCADKYDVREYVKNKIGEKYLTQLIGIYSHINEIDFDKLPSSFALKATHASGLNLICKKKELLQFEATKKELSHWFKVNYYYFNREWPYKYIPKRVICEEYLGAADGTLPLDYKIFCFDGKAKLIQLDIGRNTNHLRNVYDIHWNRVNDVEIAHPQDYSTEYEKPENLEEMLDIAEKLSSGFNHVRVDLYNNNGKIYFGELTFFHGAGMFEYFRPKAFHLEIGEWFNLPKKNIQNWTHK